MTEKVLIIEDEATTAKYVKLALERAGYQACIAIDGEDGIEKFKSDTYDLVILDIKMPNKNGEEVLVEIKKQNPFISVIVYTNHQDFINLKTLANIGIDGYVNKGSEADLNKLVEKVNEIFMPFELDDLEKLVKNTPDDFYKGDIL